MKGLPGFVILPFNLFFDLKEKYYSEVSGRRVFLVTEPFVVKALCEYGRVMLTVSPGSLIGDLEEMIDLGGCVANEYFWFEGREIVWSVKSLPGWLKSLATKVGISVGDDGNEVVGLTGSKGNVKLMRPWHPAVRALEEGLECEGGIGKGLEVAKCGESDLVSVDKGRVYLGKVAEEWRLLPALVFSASR